MPKFTAWKRRRGAGSYSSSLASQAPSIKRSIAKTRKKPFYAKTTTYTQQADEIKRASRDSSGTMSTSSDHCVPVVSEPVKEIQGGSTAAKRIGNQVNIKGFRVRGVFRNLTANSKTMMVRVIYAFNRRVHNQTMNADTQLFLKSGTPASCNDVEFEAMYLPLNNQHYDIISDSSFKLGTSAENADNSKIYSKYVKLDQLARWDDNVGANINQGNLQLFMIAYPCDGTPDLTTHVTVALDDTVYFTD